MKALILTNHQLGLYKFRREFLEKLVEDKYEVTVSVPDGEFTRELEELGIRVILDRYMDRRGTNPISDLKLLRYYTGLIKKISPDVVLTYTIKSNVYGGYVCGRLKVPYIANVTGLGTSIENGGLIRTLTLSMYKNGLKKAQKVFFQNRNNMNYMLDRRVISESKCDLLPGSGVNTESFGYLPYPENDKKVVFTTIGRIMRDKGIDELLSAASEIKKNYPEVVFRLIGDYDENCEKTVEQMVQRGVIEHIPFQKDIRPFISESHAIIHASYHEGMSNVLLEAASSGRPVIATNVPGCIETFEPGVTGISFEPKSAKSLVTAIEQFLSLTHDQKKQMGKSGREKMVREFDRNIVIEKYMDQIGSIAEI